MSRYRLMMGRTPWLGSGTTPRDCQKSHFPLYRPSGRRSATHIVTEEGLGHADAGTIPNANLNRQARIAAGNTVTMRSPDNQPLPALECDGLGTRVWVQVKIIAPIQSRRYRRR